MMKAPRYWKRAFQRTLTQLRLDEAIRRAYAAHGAGVKVAELARTLGVRAPTLYRHLVALERDGRLHQHVGRGPRRLVPVPISEPWPPPGGQHQGESI